MDKQRHHPFAPQVVRTRIYDLWGSGTVLNAVDVALIVAGTSRKCSVGVKRFAAAYVVVQQFEKPTLCSQNPPDLIYP